MNYRITEEDFDRSRFSSDERMTSKRARRDIDTRSRERKLDRSRHRKVRRDEYGDYGNVR